MVIVKANKDSEAGVLPDQKILAENGQVQRRAREGRRHARRRRAAGELQGRARSDSEGPSKRTVIDGPFTETKELIAGFWLWQVKSKEEALEWLKRAPFQEGEVELRQVFETEDFGESMTPEMRAQEERLRAQVAGKK